MHTLLTYDFPPQRGGVARYNAALVRAMPECRVMVLDRTVHWLTHYRRMVRLRAEERATRLIVSEVLPVGTMAWMLHRRLHVPYVVICHGLDLRNAQRQPRKRWLVRLILAHADHTVVNSQFTARLAAQCGAPSDRIVTIPPPVSITPASNGEHVSAAQTPLVLSVGRLIARKGFDTLIDAMAIVQRTIPEARLAIVGDGPQYAELHHRLANRHVRGTIERAADDAALRAYYAQCSLFALLPRELPNGDVEGFGIVYLEAGSYGKPVVGTWSGGVPEAVLDQETGLLVSPDDPSAAAAAITHLLSDPALAARLGSAARMRAQEFTQEHFARRFHVALFSSPTLDCSQIPLPPHILFP